MLGSTETALRPIVVLLWLTLARVLLCGCRQTYIWMVYLFSGALMIRYLQSDKHLEVVNFTDPHNPTVFLFSLSLVLFAATLTNALDVFTSTNPWLRLHSYYDHRYTKLFTIL